VEILHLHNSQLHQVFSSQTDSQLTPAESQSQSYVTTDDKSATLSWNKAPIWDLWPDLYYCQVVAVFLCGALSLTRGRVCCLQLLLVLTSAVILGSESVGNRDPILLSQIRNFPFRRLLRLARENLRAFLLASCWVWTVLNWLGIETRGRIFWTRQLTVRFRLRRNPSLTR
jgi:hypothetical protein